MNHTPDIDADLRENLRSIYEEVMWLSRRPNVTSSRARAWYTHIMAESVKRKLRYFTGSVSKGAIEQKHGQLMLEHYLRIQTRLSALVEKHRAAGANDPDEFIDLLIKCEQVHIVTRDENYAAMRGKGNYVWAKIHLVSWNEIPLERQTELWRTMLKGKVANAAAFAPTA